MKTFLAPDMRTALKLVREEFGDDAVILSNRRVEGGVELLAAADMPPPPPKPEPQMQAVQPAAPAPTMNAPTMTSAQATGIPVQVTAPGMPSGEFADINTVTAQRGDSGWWQMQQELNSMRDLLEQQFSNFAWHDYRSTQPGAAAMWRRLQRLGLDPRLIAKLIENSEGVDLRIAKTAWQALMKKLSDALPVIGHDLIGQGGAFAFIGPTGAGKTTTIGKLAARYVLEHGAADVALVTMDGFRIGAHEQLRTLARILGVPFKIAANPHALANVLYELRHCKLILIDTAGLNSGAPELKQQLAAIHALGDRVQCVQVLPANSHASALKAANRAYRTGNLTACVLTKLDEIGTLGEALSLLIEAGVPLAYTADGQNIPGDLALADARQLISRAIDVAKNAEGDEARLAQAYAALRNGQRQSLTA
jgi:flagellar biosynthesis protein FlhF